MVMACSLRRAAVVPLNLEAGPGPAAETEEGRVPVTEISGGKRRTAGTAGRMCAGVRGLEERAHCGWPAVCGWFFHPVAVMPWSMAAPNEVP